MNTKKDKIQLLRDIEAGLIDPADIPPDPVICCQRKEMFLGLLMASGGVQIVLCGQAEKALTELTQSHGFDQEAI